MAETGGLNDFPPADATEWRQLVERALDGRPFETLISHTFEGLEIQPLYQRAMAGGPRACRQHAGAWKIAQRIDHPDPATANHMARIDLDGGADALNLTITGASTARGFGTEIHTVADLDATLDTIDLELVPLRIDAGLRSLEIAEYLRLLAHERRLGSASLDMDFGHDPIGAFARSGTLSWPHAIIGRDSATASRSLRDSGFCGHLFLADGRPYHEAGAGEAQELAFVLGTAVTYLKCLDAAGLGLEEARDEIAFLLAADADQFLTLAKFRALRRLWAHVESTCGLDAKPLRLHAETSFRMMTRQDPRMNVLRTTAAAVGAALGGADIITVLPFTLALGLPNEAARRLARNSQLVLIHEAQLAKVADTTAGSGCFEALTEALCRRAWALFQRLEQQGGMIASLEAGLPHALVGATAAARRAAIARRRLAITGTSAFPDLGEIPVQVLEPARTAPEGAPANAAANCRPLPAERDAEPFERLRTGAGEILARTGSRPRIFILSLGSAPAVATDVAFARDLFAVAGFEAAADAGTGTPDEIAAVFSRSSSKIVCICVSKSVAADTTRAHIDALRAAGAAGIYLVGRSHDFAAGLQLGENVEIVAQGCDVIAVLRKALAQATVLAP